MLSLGLAAACPTSSQANMHLPTKHPVLAFNQAPPPDQRVDLTQEKVAYRDAHAQIWLSMDSSSVIDLELVGHELLGIMHFLVFAYSSAQPLLHSKMLVQLPSQADLYCRPMSATCRAAKMPCSIRVLELLV